MPLFKTFSPEKGVRVIIWCIEESEDQLRDMVRIHPSDRKKLEKLKNPEKIREFLALRCCLREHFGTNPEVFYQDNGKPFLKNGYYISFSHTRGYAAAIFSEKYKVGIDLETHRESIKRIAPKFMGPEEFRSLNPECDIQQIIHYWGAKEVIVKIEGDRRLNFIGQIRIKPIHKNNLNTTTGTLIRDEETKNYKLFFEYSQPVYLSYGWELFTN